MGTFLACKLGINSLQEERLTWTRNNGMARDSEKKDHMFAKWVAMKRADDLAASGKGTDSQRPYLASDCDSIQECEKRRRGIISEIALKMTALENAAVGEHRIRELNDEVNKLVRTNSHWDKRIRELGGDPSKYQRHHFEVDGVELPGARGYKYYGAAKNLPGMFIHVNAHHTQALNTFMPLTPSNPFATIYPISRSLTKGIRELFDQSEAERAAERANRRKRRGEGAPRLTSAYWGREDDSTLIQDELQKEKGDVKHAMTVFNDTKKSLMAEGKASGHLQGQGRAAAELAAMQDDSHEEFQIDVYALAVKISSADADATAKASSEQVDLDSMLVEAQKQTLLSRFNL